MSQKLEGSKSCPGSLRILLAVLSLMMFLTAASAQTGLHLPPYQKVKLSNGMTVILMKQAEVPLVSISLTVRNGSLQDPEGREGLASVTADLLRKGTRKRSAQKIASELDFVGGTLDFTTGPDFVRGQAEFLKKDLSTGLDVLSDIFINPSFPAPEVSKLLKQRIDGIKEAKDQAQAVIYNYFYSSLFGNSGYGRPFLGDELSLTRITRTDVAEFYRRNYGPGTITMAVVGDIEPSECLKMLESRFGSWKQAATAAPLPAASMPVKGKRLLLIDKPDSTQTYFVIGNLGISRNDPDRVAVDIVNTVFGGRFTSLLNEALRVSSGLTYGASSRFLERTVPGPFFITSYTQNKTTVEAIDMAVEVLRKLHADGLSPDQLASAKAYIKGQFPTRVETSNQLADLLADYDYYGLDDAELNRYFERIDAITLTDVRRVVDRCYPLDNLVFVLVGKADEIKSGVAKYAPAIVERKISQPGFH